MDRLDTFGEYVELGARRKMQEGRGEMRAIDFDDDGAGAKMSSRNRRQAIGGDVLCYVGNRQPAIDSDSRRVSITTRANGRRKRWPATSLFSQKCPLFF